MKNKIINFLFILVFILSYNVKANSTEFVFESEYIEFKNSGNIIEAKNGVKITSDNEIEITADESLYNKLTLELILKGNVVFIDVIRDIKIQSQEAPRSVALHGAFVVEMFMNCRRGASEALKKPP